MFRRRHPSLALRLAIGAATCWTLFLLGGYFLEYRAVRRHHLESALFIVAGLVLALTAAQRHATEPTVAAGWPPWWIVWTSALAVAILLYWPAFHLGFLSDDFVLAGRAQEGEFVARTHEFVRPVPLAIWRVMLISGGGAVALHSLNVLLHAVNSVLTAALAGALGVRAGTALFAGLLFLIWPTQVESVAWASGVFDTLMTTLVLLLATTYLDTRRSAAWLRYAVLLLLTALALGTKETAVAIPVLLAAALVPQRRAAVRPSRHQWSQFLLISALCASYAVWRIFLRDAAAHAMPPISSYVVKELVSRTFASLAIPFTTEWMKDWNIAVALFSALIILLSVGRFLLETRNSVTRATFVAIAWPILAAAPAVGYLFIGNHLDGSRYLYLPMAGWAIFLALSTEWVAHRTTHRLPLVICAVAALGIITAQSRTLLNDWREAASLRDALLDDAIRSAEEHGCLTAHFSNAPARHHGAQLFNNGLDEAVTQRRRPGVREGSNSCQFSWTGVRFARTPI